MKLSAAWGGKIGRRHSPRIPRPSDRRRMQDDLQRLYEEDQFDDEDSFGCPCCRFMDLDDVLVSVWYRHHIIERSCGGPGACDESCDRNARAIVEQLLEDNGPRDNETVDDVLAWARPLISAAMAGKESQ